MTTIDGVWKLFKVRFLEEGSNAKIKEQNAYMMFMHYLEDCEKGESFAMSTLIITYYIPAMIINACTVLNPY